MSSVMFHYPNARKLRVDSMTRGVSWADQELQNAMVSSALIKAEKVLKDLEEKDMFDVTSYGQAWIADNIKYLSGLILERPTTEICKAFIDFPQKLNLGEGKFLPTDEYLANLSFHRSRGIKYIAAKDGEVLDRKQQKINEFVLNVSSAQKRSMTISFIVLNSLLNVIMNKDEANGTWASVSSKLMDNIITQFISLKGLELKEIMEVPSVRVIQNASLWTNAKGEVNRKGKKLLDIFGIKKYKSLSKEGTIAEGISLIDLVCEAIPAISRNNAYLYIDSSIRTKLEDIRSRVLDKVYEARPVLEKPKTDGYYTSYRAFPLKDYLVQGYEGKESVRISEFDAKAIDRIQGTPFNINTDVLSTVSKLIEMNYEIEDKLCLTTPPNYEPLSDFPVKGNYSSRTAYNEAKTLWFTMDDNKERYFKWKAKSKEREQLQKKCVSINDINVRTLEIAKWYAEWGGPFYLPVFMDYRTRMYYIPTILNPQSSKLAKSLFIASRGKPIGTEKALEYWLVNFAGSMKEIVCDITGKVYGGDKAPWNVAVKAGRKELKVGAAIAKNPFSEESLKRWTKQDNPFEYLAHCFECEGILEYGLEFCSRIFIGMDGSCNAYQHAAGYLADRDTASLVNLTYRGPDDDPADLYNEVSNEFIGRLDVKSNSFHKLFRFHDLVSRKGVKRITMCQGYGLTPSGAKNYGLEEIEKLTDQDTMRNPFDILGRDESAGCFSEGVMDSVRTVAPAIMKVKEALQIIGSLACDPVWNPSGEVKWTTYTGTPVTFTKKKEVHKWVDRIAGNKRVRFSLTERSDQVDEVSVSNAQAPNYTHSKDADHMRLSLNEMPEGTPFLVIHDSFGCLTADAPEFCQKIKETFVRMYKGQEPLKGLIMETLGNKGGCLDWLVKQSKLECLNDMEWLFKEGNLESIKAEFKRGMEFSGTKLAKFRQVIRDLIKVRDRIVQTKDLDFDEILTCIYPFR